MKARSTTHSKSFGNRKDELAVLGKIVLDNLGMRLHSLLVADTSRFALRHNLAVSAEAVLPRRNCHRQLQTDFVPTPERDLNSYAVSRPRIYQVDAEGKGYKQ